MFNDGGLRAPRGFHLSAKALIALAVAATFGGYAVARESKSRATTPVVVEKPVRIQRPVTPMPPAIDPATEATSSTPAVPKVERSGAPTTPVVPAPASASPDAPTPAPGD